MEQLLRLLPLLLVLSFSNCSSVQQTLNPDLFYKRDMRVQMDGMTGEGVLVVPSALKHTFKVTGKAPMDLYTFTTCHREIAIEGMNKEVSGYFTPAVGLEDTGACPVEFGGYDKKGKHSWAFVDFETPEANLPAIVKCNGEKYESKGVTICQSRAGLFQRIEFPVEVVTAGSADCGKLIPKEGGKVLEFALPKGRCVFAIGEKGGGRIHRLTTLGYESILLRDE